jgi:hypothetical protein
MAITDIHLKDENAGLEYCLHCDLEAGKLMGWHVDCYKEPLPLQMAFNLPYLLKPAGMPQSPCAQKAEAAQRKAIRIGADGKPIERN